MKYRWKNPPLITDDTHIHEGELKIIEDVDTNIRTEKIECEHCGVSRVVSYDVTVRSNI